MSLLKISPKWNGLGHSQMLIFRNSSTIVASTVPKNLMISTSLNLEDKIKHQNLRKFPFMSVRSLHTTLLCYDGMKNNDFNPNLDKVASALAIDLTRSLMYKINTSLYDPRLKVEDRIRGNFFL